MSMMKEFREFAMRGNVVDLAVAFVMGVAFGAVVNSLVDNLLMPVIAMIAVPSTLEESALAGGSGTLTPAMAAYPTQVAAIRAPYLSGPAYQGPSVGRAVKSRRSRSLP
jgi:large-conductance mechanosensitive channel